MTDPFYPNPRAPPSMAGSASVPSATLQGCHEEHLLYDTIPRTGGFLYRFEGKTYFSPNCHRSNLTPPPDLQSLNDGAIQGRDFDIEHFHKPQWWTPAHGYLAFLPLRPNLSSPPLHPLLRVPKVLYDTTKSQFYPDPLVWKSWKELQSKLIHAIHLLVHRSAAPIIYKGPGGKNALKEDIYAALSWFSVWFGCTAYAIAFSEAMDRAAQKGGYRVFPGWMEILASDLQSKLEGKGTSEARKPEEELDGRFICNLPSTCLGCFDATMTICLLSTAWFRLTGSSLSMSQYGTHGDLGKSPLQRRTPSGNAMHPPPDAVYAYSSPNSGSATSATVLQPLMPAPVPNETFVPYQHRKEPDAKERTWEPWFKAREERNALIMPKQSQAARNRRLNWLRNPPTNPKKTKFFVWDKDEDGIFRRRKAEEDDLEDLFGPDGNFSKAQARYDPVSNEWDLCEFFGPPDNARLLRLAEQDSEYRGTTVEHELELWKIHYGLVPSPDFVAPGYQQPVADSEANISAVHGITEDELGRVDEPVAVPEVNDDSDLRITVLSEGEPPPEQVQFIAHRFFGYLKPLSTMTAPSSPLNAAFVPKALGIGKLHATSDALWSTTCGQHILSFFHSLMKGAIVGDLCDLGKYSRAPVVSLPRFRILRRSVGESLIQEVDWDNAKGRSIRSVEKQVSTYWFASDHGQGWRLGCLSAAVALTICRWDDDMDPTAIVFSFLGLGIRFHTWREVSKISSVTLSTFPDLVKLITYRHTLETFDDEDYTIYVRQVCSILKTRPGVARAALMRGGIVWRLTMEYVSPNDVLCGPSQSAMEGEGIVRRNGTGGFLVDDALQVQEVDAICGHIDFWSSQELQFTRMSWWPPADLWDQRYGFTGWSPDAEDFYYNRLAEIKRTWKPLPRSEWRKRLRQSSALKATLSAMEKLAEDVWTSSNEGGL
ncbi:hypothetical protein DFP72DRAFT_840303 [Ephemerocybe angulata]|uniref:Uncharacterized protein n=1 Tax=Ephemerocybe angulata TaxID=980116 RepID=A0A8H6MG46_9AGAR|nr:hypothetical protein DFP72DRAFT_840303 [Tulosesus angulatus]